MTLILAESLVLDPLTPEEWREIQYDPDNWSSRSSHTLKFPRDERYAGYLIVLPGECYAIGVLNVNDDDEIRFALHDDFRGKGYGKEAVLAWANAHNTMGSGRTIYATTYKDEKAGAKVLLYAGFIPVEEKPDGSVRWELRP